MASRLRLRLRLLSSSAAARPLVSTARLPTTCSIRSQLPSATPPAFSRPKAPPSRLLRPLPSCSHRPFSHSPRRLNNNNNNDNSSSNNNNNNQHHSQDTHHSKTPEYDYDPSLGDPWFHHRLRNAKPFSLPSLLKPNRFPTTRTVVLVALVAAVAFYYANLEVVPVSGRRRFNCCSDATTERLGEIAYKQLLDDIEKSGVRVLPPDDPRTRTVRRVMRRLIPVIGGDGVKTRVDDWEVHVLDDAHAANAFVLPGGKVFVYSGLLRLARTDAQIAAVLAHEIAHGMAGHIGERLSQSAGQTLFLGSVLALLIATPLSFVAGYLFGGPLVQLVFAKPMSRVQEKEADYIGLMVMAEACYDPREALVFWERLSCLSGQLGQEPPEFLSTHPSDRSRFEAISRWLPEAMEKMEQSDCRGTQGFRDALSQAMRRGTVFNIAF